MKDVCKRIQSNGWRALLVGGAVRDMVQGLAPKDLDIEVYGASPDALEAFLSTIADDGKVNAVGKSFGVLKCRINTQDYDFSCPRRENKVGQGHKGFIMEFDPTITPKEAAARRDFTFNALAYDPLSEEVLDFFGGKQDLENRVLRHTSDAFAEDSLRVLRGMQFAARFDLTVADETAELMQTLSPDDLAIERIFGEWEKLLLKGKKPSAGLQLLRRVGWLPKELEALVGCAQDAEWHPEGDVFEHTCQALDAAAEVCMKEGITGVDRMAVMLAALVHDMGKPAVTTINAAGRIVSPGHAADTSSMESFMCGIGVGEELLQNAVLLAKEHMAHLQQVSQRMVRRLAARLSPMNIKLWSVVVEADHSGRGSLEKGLPDAAKQVLELAEEQQVLAGKPAPVWQGRDLIAIGMQPGRQFGEILRALYEAQLDGTLREAEERLLELHTSSVAITVHCGPGSGNWKHAGRLGKVGGSAKSH